MSTFSAVDHAMMARALQLAEKGYFLARPNPRVGCVLTKHDNIIGEGYHQQYGQAHAEVNALSQAGGDSVGATAYVTLEPCAHQGKTGPCCEALIRARVSRVVVAMTDPFPQVNGGGIARLKEAGIKVDVGLMEVQAKALNPGFICRLTRKRPYIRIKLAQSLDGRTAMANGESVWITGAAARQDVQHLRARHDAIITGSGTVISDNPSLNVRLHEVAQPPEQRIIEEYQQPLRVVLDRQNNCSLNERLFSINSPILFVSNQVKHDSTTSHDDSLHAHDDFLPAHDSLPSHIETLKIPTEQDELTFLLKYLADRECNEVLVEAGATLAGSFFKAGLWDELVVYQAPRILGKTARPLLDVSLSAMTEALDLSLKEVRQIEQDLRLTFVPT